MVEQDAQAAGTLRPRLSRSGTRSACRRSTHRIRSGNCSTLAPSPRFPNGAAAGARAPRNTHAPLTLSGSRPMTEQTLLPACRRIPSSSAPDASLHMQERPPAPLCLVAPTPLSIRCRRAGNPENEGAGWSAMESPGSWSGRESPEIPPCLPRGHFDHRPRNRCDSPRHCVALGLDTVQLAVLLGGGPVRSLRRFEGLGKGSAL